ncbi:MAG TPA: isochorismatase family cysteine hydrolase [Edaphobacter sp.]|jgi:nicotinamidase-related amidase|nr:isochorismatase family cysteine hydrolase [Edaphobacter sp.]
MEYSKTSLQKVDAPVALLLIDVINHFEFPDGVRTLRQAYKIAPAIARLKRRARRAGIPVIYVNDNFGDWRAERSVLLAYCLRSEAASAKFVSQLGPDEEDYFVLKPMHSAFYQTPLEVLLRHLGTHTIILAGLATNSCITCTAHDANMRDLQVFVPSDCSAARTIEEHRKAIRHLQTMANATTTRSQDLNLSAIKRKSRCDAT